MVHEEISLLLRCLFLQIAQGQSDDTNLINHYIDMETLSRGLS